MKFRTITQRYMTEHTRDGITVPVEKTRQVTVPALPRDMDAVAIKAASGLVLTLTLISIVWSTWSIGGLLGSGIGFLAAVVFDLAWGVCLLLEWMARFDVAKRKFPRVLGWLLLLATMGAIFWHGMERGNVAMGVCGAAVSAFAKALWLGVMKHIDRDLSPEDAQWVAAQISAANAKMAVASVRRQVARIEDRAAAELLALEAARSVLPEDMTGLSSLQALQARPEDALQAAGTAPSLQSRTVVPASRQVPQDDVTEPVQPVEVEAPEAPSTAGTSGPVLEDPEGQVPQVDKSSVRSAGTSRDHLRPVRGAATAEIRHLIGAGITEPSKIRDRLAVSGTKVPDASYIRRLIREARDNGGTDSGTGNYM